MIDSMFQTGTDMALADQQQRPAALKPPRLGFWAGFGESAGRGLGGAGLEAGAFASEITGAFGQVLGATGTDSAGGMFATQTPQERQQAEAARNKLAAPGGGIEYSTPSGDKLRTAARDFMPDPASTGTAGQMVAGLTNFAGKAVGYGIALGPLGPVALAGDVGMTEADKLKQQGVDLPTRTKAGAVAGAVAGVSVVVPLSGPTALSRFAVGTGVGVGSIVGQTAAERVILRAAGYDKIADTYDPLDPVTLALGMVPGLMGARFGKPKPLRTEAQMREAAKLTPAEQARSDAFEASPANLKMLEDAIKAEKRPEIRAELQAELVKQQGRAGEVAVQAAIHAEPELVPAARVVLAAEALDANRLTADADLAGRDRHVSAVEMAADQMGRGERVEVTDMLPAIETQAVADVARQVDPLEPVAPSRTDRVMTTAAAADQLRAAREPLPEPAAPREPPAKPQDGPAKASKQPLQGQGKGDTAEPGQAHIDRAASEAAALDPDMLVHMDGMDAPVRVGDFLEQVKAQAAEDTKMGKLLEVAAACDLRA